MCSYLFKDFKIYETFFLYFVITVCNNPKTRSINIGPSPLFEHIRFLELLKYIIEETVSNLAKEKWAGLTDRVPGKFDNNNYLVYSGTDIIHKKGDMTSVLCK